MYELPAQALPVPEEGEDEAVRRVSPRLSVRLLRHARDRDQHVLQ